MKKCDHFFKCDFMFFKFEPSVSVGHEKRLRMPAYKSPAFLGFFFLRFRSLFGHFFFILESNMISIFNNGRC